MTIDLDKPSRRGHAEVGERVPFTVATTVGHDELGIPQRSPGFRVIKKPVWIAMFTAREAAGWTSAEATAVHGARFVTVSTTASAAVSA